MKRPYRNNMRSLYKDDLRAYEQAFDQMVDNEVKGNTGIVLALRDKEQLSQLTAEEKDRDNRADLVDRLDKFMEMEE